MPCDIDSKSMAESVTRHAQISHIDEIKNLACGIDTLDIGFYVAWGSDWKALKEKFETRKLQAQGKDNILIEEDGVRPHLFYASGKAPNYRYHLKFSEYHCFIAISDSAFTSPNIYISFTSESLHYELSEVELIDLARQDIESFGGHVNAHKISRCDLYCDFKVPGGLSLEFLRTHMVKRAEKTNHYMGEGDRLETFYVGEKKSRLQIRIYDKGKEIQEKETEERWLLWWFVEDSCDVWRIEAQIRRTMLNEYSINTIDDLLMKRADLWRYVTDDWFTLRYHDNDNTTRRTVHEFWKRVQQCSEMFGLQSGARRRYDKKKATNIKWHVARIANHVISCGAIMQSYDIESCIQQIIVDVRSLLLKCNFADKAKEKSLELGKSLKVEVHENGRELFNRLIES